MSRRICRSHVCVHKPIAKELQPRINSAGLIEAIGAVARAFVYSDCTNVRTGPQRFLQAQHRIVGPGIEPIGADIYIHHSEFQAAESSRQLRAAIDGHLLAGHKINADLAAEEELVLDAAVEAEDAGIFEKELAFLRNKYLEGRQVEWLGIDVGVSEVSIEIGRASCRG